MCSELHLISISLECIELCVQVMASWHPAMPVLASRALAAQPACILRRSLSLGRFGSSVLVNTAHEAALTTTSVPLAGSVQWPGMLQSGWVSHTCSTCKPGTVLVHPSRVFGMHLADSISLDPFATKHATEDCAFIGRIVSMPGTPESAFQVVEASDEQKHVREGAVQALFSALQRAADEASAG
jgi:hypothetical protein